MRRIKIKAAKRREVVTGILCEVELTTFNGLETEQRVGFKFAALEAKIPPFVREWLLSMKPQPPAPPVPPKADKP